MDFDPDSYLASDSSMAFDPDAHLVAAPASAAPPTPRTAPEKPTVQDVEAMHDVMEQTPGDIGQGGYDWKGLGRSVVGAATSIPSIIPIIGPSISEAIRQAT